MNPDLPEHDHCRFCGDAVPFDQAYCSEECYYADQEVIRKERFRNAAIAAIAVAGSAIILILGYIF